MFTRTWRQPAGHIAIILGVGLLFTAPGMRPGRVLAPIDMLSDFGLWKPDLFERRPVSNGVLSDVVLQFIPWDVEVTRHLAAHEMPYMNVWAQNGRPLWSNPQAAILCPTTWPRFAFGLSGWAFCVFLRLALAGVGMYLLALALDASPAAAVVAALLFSMCGAMFAWALHPHGNTLAFLPWLIVAHLRLARAPSRGRVLAAVAATFLYTTGGHPETLFVGGIIAVILVSGERSAIGTRAGRALFRCALVGFAGFLAAGLAWVPFLHLLIGSDAPGARGTGEAASSPWAMLLSLVVPGTFGSPIMGEIDLTRFFPRAGLFFSRAPAYIGALVLFTLVVTFRHLAGRWRRFATLGGVFLVVALLEPLAPRFVRELPILDLVNPLYAWLGFAFFSALAAGTALCVAFDAPVRPRMSAVLLIGGAALLVGGLLPVLPITSSRIGTVIDHKLADSRRNGILLSPIRYYEGRRAEYLRLVQRTAIHRAAIPGVIVLCGGIAWRKRKRHVFTVLALAELFAFDLGYLPVARARHPLVASPLLDAVRDLDPGRQWMIAAGPNVFPPNLATLAGVRDVRSYDALESGHAIMSLVAGGYDPRTLAIREDLTDGAVDALKRLGTRFLLMREQPVHAVWRAGSRPPAVGLYDLGQDAARSALPQNARPKGFTAGIGVSVLGVVLSAGLIMLVRPQQRSTVSR